LLKDIVDKRKDCVAFLSCPVKDGAGTDSQKLDKCLTYRTAIGSSSYVVIDSGYKYMYDIYNDKNRWVPLNADIAGLCARSDINFDPWWSPAGLNRGQVRNVIKLAFQPRQAARDNLYKNNVNPVCTFTGEGTVLYGDKTAQTKPSAFDRINVRRLFIVLEKAIATAAKYSLFEFNDAFTRAQFRSLVEPFLRDVQARRGVIDFKVVCDEKNNTPEVIDGNRFVADIYIKPNRSINFIQLNFIATRTGVSFSEVGA
jgi:phage tail sheath protein FI